MAAYKPMGTALLEVRASGPVSAPSANGTLTLESVGAHYEQSDLTGIYGILSFTEQDLTTPKLAWKAERVGF